MDEKKVRTITQEEINKYMNQKQYTYSKIPSHSHTGIDVQKVKTSDLDYGTNEIFSIIAYGTNPAVTETFRITIPFSKARRIAFYGFAADGGNGTPFPDTATRKAMINGEALFGKAVQLTTLDPTPTTTSDLDNIIQGSNYVYILMSSFADTRVGWASSYLAHAASLSGAILATANVVGYSTDSITIEFFVNVGCYLSGTYIITS